MLPVQVRVGTTRAGHVTALISDNRISNCSESICDFLTVILKPVTLQGFKALIILIVSLSTASAWAVTKIWRGPFYEANLSG